VRRGGGAAIGVGPDRKIPTGAGGPEQDEPVGSEGEAAHKSPPRNQRKPANRNVGTAKGDPSPAGKRGALSIVVPGKPDAHVCVRFKDARLSGGQRGRPPGLWLYGAG